VPGAISTVARETLGRISARTSTVGESCTRGAREASIAAETRLQ
jgi:hypothetical protein